MDRFSKANVNHVVSRFVDMHKKDKHVIAIVATGSYFHSKPDKNSDIDIYVVLDKSGWRERGNTFINGIEVEYFVNPVAQIRHYLKKEGRGEHPSTAHMLVNGDVVYRKGDAINRLIEESKKVLKNPPKLKRTDVELAKYALDDIYKDLEDVYVRKDIVAFNMIAGELTEKCLNVFYQAKGLWKEKTKRLEKSVKSLDPRFALIFVKSQSGGSIRDRFMHLKMLRKYTEKLVGGRRPKEWKLRTKCDYS